MTELILYDATRRDDMIMMIADFFAGHSSITSEEPITVTPDRLADAEENLAEWSSGGDTLFIIRDDGADAGFIRLSLRGDTAWIEDIFVKAELRGRGIATRAIALAEKYASEVLGSDSVSLDVIPQNTDAIRLYRSLGYDTVPLITLRKRLSGDKPRTPVSFNGFNLFI